MNGLPGGAGAPRRPDAPLPAARPGAAASVAGATPADAAAPHGDEGRPNACTRLKAFLQSLPKAHKGFAYLYAAAGGAGTGAKVGAVYTLGHPVATIGMSTAYAILALVAQATKDSHTNVSEAIMNLEGLTSEAAGSAMKSGPWGLRFVIWTLQSAEIIEGAKRDGLSDLETASLAGFSAGFAVLTHTLVIAALIDLIGSADKLATRTFGGALEAAGTPLRTVAPANWAQSVTFGFSQPAILGWGIAVATGNTEMLIGGAAKWLTKSVGDAVVVQSGMIATILFTAGTGYSINKGEPFKPIKIGESALNELRDFGVPLLVSGMRMPRVSALEFAPSPNTCKQVMQDLAQAAFSPPVLFGIATFANYLLARNPEVDVLGLFTAADTGTQPPVDGGDDIHRVAGRMLVSTLPYAAGWILELVKGWDLSKSPDGIKKLDQVMPTRLGDMEHILLSLMTAASVAWTTEILTGPDANETMGMPAGLGVLLSVLVPFGGVVASAELTSNSKRLAADAATTLTAGVLAGLEPDLHGKEIMLGTLGLWLGGRAFIEWSVGSGDRVIAAVLAQPDAPGPAQPDDPGRARQGEPMPMPALVDDEGTPEPSDIRPLLGEVSVSRRDAPREAEVYSEAAVERRRQSISRLMGRPYKPGTHLPGDGSRSSTGAGITLPPGTTWASWTERIDTQLGPPPWDMPRPVAMTPLHMHIESGQVQQHVEAARQVAKTALGDIDEVSIRIAPSGVDSDSGYEDEVFSTSSRETSPPRTDSDFPGETDPNGASSAVTPGADANAVRTPQRTPEMQQRYNRLADTVMKLPAARRHAFLQALEPDDRNILLKELEKYER